MKSLFLLLFIVAGTPLGAQYTITTIAGTGSSGSSGDNGLATNAAIGNPNAMVMDPAGNLYFTDELNFRIRKIDASGIITTIAGNGSTQDSGDGGLAVNAGLGEPQGSLSMPPVVSTLQHAPAFARSLMA